MQGNLTVGMLAHVDAGKTTLTEAMLFRGGGIKRLGRVDHRDAFLDTDAMERRRGITIFAKQAILPLEDMTLTLLDTPGHVDFSAEMERTLQVLDYAVLVVSGADGVQGHTATLWKLLARYGIPTFLFVNKMDLPGALADALLAELRQRLDPACVAFSGGPPAQNRDEEIALCDEAALAQFLDRGRVEDDTVISLIRDRRLFPCFFGAALRLEGIDELLSGIARYARPPAYPDAFGAKVYKISRDPQGVRLTHLKITGGSLAVRAPLTGRGPAIGEGEGEPWTEKVSGIRLYSGEKFRAAEQVPAGAVCAVTGLHHSYPGQGLGIEPDTRPPALEPVLSYRVLLPAGCDAHTALGHLRELEEEDPQLAVTWSEASGEIGVQLMGEVQLEVLAQVLAERFGLAAGFDAGEILYRETIAAPVIGMGHFEPLRHYAEVHLLLEPGPRGSGLQLDTRCSEDVLARNWQRLVLSHLAEREHPGVLTGAPLTDLKITLLTGRAHNKHTEGGDFRQATFRALRQGLMQAKNILLEPWYRFELELPGAAVGRAMTDLQRMTDELTLPEGDGARALLTGRAPVAALRDYAAEVTAYTRGEGRLSCAFDGFAPCRDQDGAVAASGYDPARDVANPADSVFCSHGAGVTVRWDQAKKHMHLDSGHRLEGEGSPPSDDRPAAGAERGKPAGAFEQDAELRAIFERTYGPVRRRDVLPGSLHTRSRPRAEGAPVKSDSKPPRAPEGPDYLLIDGYNIIHAWEDLGAIARQSLDAARKILMDLLCNYRSMREREVILVFDAYKVPDGERRVERYHNINVVYTAEAETADAYIEAVTYKLRGRRRVTVATSDGAVQLIIFGHGALRMTPQALRLEIDQANADIAQAIEQNNRTEFSPSIRLPEREEE